MEYSPMMLVVIWALAPSDAVPLPMAAVETQAQVVETPQRVMSVQPLATFNYGKPFLGQPDPVTGAVEVKTTPVSEDDYIYEEFEESGESVDRKDGSASINQIVSTSNKEAELHKFLNLPASYPTKPFKYPLISSSYANTKIQGHGASNHRPAPASSTPSTMSPSYYTHRPTTVTTITTTSPSTTSTTTSTTTTTPRPPSPPPPPPQSHNYEYEDYYDYDKPHRGNDYDFLGSSAESSQSTSKAPSTTSTKATPKPTITTTRTTSTTTTTNPPSTTTTVTTSSSRAPSTSSTVEIKPFTKFPDLRRPESHTHQVTKDTSIVPSVEVVTGEEEDYDKDEEPEKNELATKVVTPLSSTNATTTMAPRPALSVETTRAPPQTYETIHESEWMQSGPLPQFPPPPSGYRPSQQPMAFETQRPPSRPTQSEPLPNVFNGKLPQQVDSTRTPILETSYPPMLNFRPQNRPLKPQDVPEEPEKRPQFVPPSSPPSPPRQPPRDPAAQASHLPPKHDRPQSHTDLQTSFVKFERPHLNTAPSPPVQDTYVKFERPQVIPERRPQPPPQQSSPQLHQQQEHVIWPKVRPTSPHHQQQQQQQPQLQLQHQKPQQQQKPPYSFFPISDNEHLSRPVGIGSVEAVRPPPRPSQAPGQGSGSPDSQSYSLQTSFSIDVPPTKYQAPPWAEPTVSGHGNKPFKDPLKRKPLPNILPQFRPNAKIGSVEPVPPPYPHHLSSKYPKEPAETLEPPPLPRPAYLRSEEPPSSPPQFKLPAASLPMQPVHRRNGLGTKVTTLQMMQQPLPATLKSEDPVLIVYPSNNGDPKRTSSVTAGTPSVPVDPEDSFLLDDANTRRIDTPVLKGTKQHVKVEFPYPLLKPTEEYLADDTLDENSSPSSSSASPPQSTSAPKEYNAFSPTSIAPHQEGDAEINAVPYLQDYQPFATKRPSAAASSSAPIKTHPSTNSHTGDLWEVGSVVKPISVTLDTGASIHQPHHNHKVVTTNNGPPQPQDLEAPFAASPSHGWSVVNTDRTKRPTEAASEETSATSVETTTNKEFSMSNFKPQLFGGFKPIVSPSET